MEFASNLVWAVIALGLLRMTYSGVRSGTIRLSMASAIMLGLVLCFILLPAISISDDLLASHQAVFPPSGQTWRIASENAAVGLDGLLALAAYLFLLTCVQVESRRVREDHAGDRPLAGRLVRSQRLRPPPSLA